MGAEATLRMILLGEDRSAGKALKGVGDQAQKSHSRLQGLSNIAGKALAGGLIAAGAAAVTFAKNAATDEAAARRLSIALQNTTGATKKQVASVEDWISKQGVLYGVSDDQLRPAMERLVTATHDVGKAQKLASLAMDISAGTGKDLGTVSMALAKAQNGNVASLGRLGLKVKDADGKTKSLADVTRDLAETYKGQASAAADSTAGKQQRLNVALDEAGESIGYKLIPAMLKLTEAATAALGWMTKHQKLVAIIGGALVAMATAVWAVNAAARAYAATQAALNVVMSANPIGLVVLALAALAAGLVVAYKKSETFRNIVNGVFHAIAAAASFMWNDVLKPVFKFWVDTWFAVVGALVHGAANAFGWVPGIGPKLKAAADNFDKFRDRVNAALDGIKSYKVIHLDVKVTGTTNATLAEAAAAPGGKSGNNAVGTNFWRGGLTWVGERGRPELVSLPRGSSVMTDSRFAGMAGAGSAADYGTLTVVVKSETGEVLEQKFVKLKRKRGGRALAFI